MGCSDAPCESFRCAYDYGHKGQHSWEKEKVIRDYVEPEFSELKGDVRQIENMDMVNHPPHYRGPTIVCPKCKESFVLECIMVIRWIRDMRLANAMKYIWRVAFGGKMGVEEREDIEKSRWYLNDFVEVEI